MNDVAQLLHYTTIACTVGINSVGVGLGEGLATIAAIEAITRQPKAHADLVKIAVLGTALIETAAIMGVAIAMLLLFGAKTTVTIYSGIAELGIALAICLPGFAIGIASSMPAQRACMAAARQPFFAQKILRFMLITQSIIQTPIIFGFLIALFIKSHATDINSYAQSMQLLASGLCIGLGSIGPSIGMAQFAKTACEGIGLNRNAYTKLFSFTLVSEAIIETPIIFAVVIALLIANQPAGFTMLEGIAFLSAAFCTGLGTLGAGISSGRTAAAACYEIALDPEKYNAMSRISMFAQGLIDTCAIYAVIISIALIVWM